MARIALFAQGFRPFFLLAALWAVLAVALWIGVLHGLAWNHALLSPAQWHAHEMIAGFIGAALSGFLLTAIPNWTSRPAYGGWPLALPVAGYVLARFALLPGAPLPADAAAVIALLPLPLLLATVAPALIRAGTPRLFGPPALVLGFWAGQVLMIGDAAGWWGGTFGAGALLSLNIALALVGLVGGRIVPAFTMNALRKAGRPQELKPIPRVDQAGMVALLAVAAVDLVAPGGVVAGCVAALAALLAALRLSRWHGLKTGFSPILLVLHLAFAMLPVALAVKALHLLAGAGFAAGWLHLQAVGAVALMILAVMPRAAMGHTGREIAHTVPLLLAWGLLPLAAATRAFGPAVLHAHAHALAGLLWLAAFALFLLSLAPVLLLRRPDGKPG